MDLSHYTLQQSIGSYVNKWLKFALIATSTVSVVLAYLLYQNMRHKMTILVPPVVTHQMSLSVVRADESYLVQMGLFWLGLKLNISPDNVNQNHKILRTHIAPKAWGEIQQILEQEAEAIKTGRIASVFYPTAQEVDLPQLCRRKFPPFQGLSLYLD